MISGTSILTTAYAGAIEVAISSTARITKTYYSASSQLIAMRVATSTAQSTLYFLSSDHLGSSSLTTDASGNFVARQLYDAWGNIRSGGGLPTDIGFTGQRLDSGTNLLFMQARYYDSQIGRWSSPDSIIPDESNPQDLNRYSYVNNGPLNKTDPTGHMECYGYAPSNKEGSGFGVGADSCQGSDWKAVHTEANLGKMQDQVRAECAAANGACDVKPQDRLLLAGVGIIGLVAPELIGAGLDALTPAAIEAGTASTTATAGCASSDACREEVGQTVEDILRAISNINVIGGDMNCVSCAIATDATLAGNPASALLSEGIPLNELPQVLGQLYNPELVNQALSTSVTPGSIIQQLQAAGPSARGIVVGLTQEIAHAFNAINVQGTILFPDGQSGGFISPSIFNQLFFLRTH